MTIAGVEELPVGFNPQHGGHGGAAALGGCSVTRQG